jgi:uncharacterized protein (DUF4415 family)
MRRDDAAAPDQGWAAAGEAPHGAARPARRGRPPLPEKRPTLNMRIDADVLAALKATGPGWQTRVNALLREVVASGKVGGKA